MTSALRSLTLAISAAVALGAQDQPDFSGRWILVSSSRPRPDIPRALSVRQAVVRTNVRGEPMNPFFKDIAIDRVYESGTRSETHAIGIIGGVVPGMGKDGRPNGSRELRSVKWDQHALVFESGRFTGETPGTGVWTERREVWALQPDGRLEVAITTAGSAEKSSSVTSSYRRP